MEVGLQLEGLRYSPVRGDFDIVGANLDLNRKGMVESTDPKRTNHTGRTVITPDTSISFDEVVVPEIIAKNVTYPETVTSFNIKKLQKIVDDRKATLVLRYNKEKKTTQKLVLRLIQNSRPTSLYPGDLVERELTINGIQESRKFKPYDGFKLQKGDKIHRGTDVISEIVTEEKRKFLIREGDVVKRHLMTGDYVLLNRQPTLHLGSFLGARVVIGTDRTLKIGLQITGSLNAD